MNRFPYITDYINQVFSREKSRRDYIFVRPILLVAYFFLKAVLFPFKFLFHRRPFGFEARCIDYFMAFGLKYLATRDAAELLIRHVQIEPLLYRHLLGAGLSDSGYRPNIDSTKPKKLQGIDGDFNLESSAEITANNMTVGHDELSYEIDERFDRQQFLDNLNRLRLLTPEDHNRLSKTVLDENKQYSLQLLGATNVVMFIVIVITIFGDLKTTVKALNSFGSDSIVLWCLKKIYQDNSDVLIDLDFYMQAYNNRGHYNSSVFLSDPSQYLYYHIAFDEYAYEILRNRRPAPLAA